jgi:hypothetical protein
MNPTRRICGTQPGTVYNLSLTASRPAGPWSVEELLRLSQIEDLSCDGCQVGGSVWSLWACGAERRGASEVGVEKL